MKLYCFLIALLIPVLNSFAEIKNGYAHGISAAYQSLQAFKDLLQHDGSLTPVKRKVIEERLRNVITYIAYYELTGELLKQFKGMSPELYHEIDNIKDKKGRTTDVYVKFIPEDEGPVQAWGLTSIAQLPGDEDAYSSEYGERTVSIKVWAVTRALLVLSHEFGHVKYIIPNLATYKNYHVNNYRVGSTEHNHVGHNSDDPSGKCALEFEKKFKANYYACYLKKDLGRLESPAVQVNRIRMEILEGMVNATPLASVLQAESKGSLSMENEY